MLLLFIVMLLFLVECLARVFESRSYSLHLAKSNKVVKMRLQARDFYAMIVETSLISSETVPPCRLF